MDDSSTVDSDVSTMGHSVTSALGVKGSLSFRLHGSNQKAHVILRRVTVSDNSNGDKQVGHIVRFSLFAHKRIEVKPGKELLLTIASPDGLFKDQPIVFEADLSAPELNSEAKDVSRAAEEEKVYLPPVGIPPKMRRAWTKKVDLEVSPATEFATTRTSVGIQAEPIYVSTSMQVQPSRSQVSVQTNRTYTSTSVQVDPPPAPPRIPAAVQTIDNRKYTSLEVQTDSSKWDLSSQPWSYGDERAPGERSLSPMELDSPVYSPQLSPISIPEFLGGSEISHRKSPSSTASSFGAEDMQMSPVDIVQVRSFPSFLTSSPTLSQPSVSNKTDVERSIDTKDVLCSSHVNETPDVVKPSPLISPQSISTKKGAETKRSGKLGIHNPFVSGGFMTEFVGQADRQALSTQENSISETEMVTGSHKQNARIVPMEPKVAPKSPSLQKVTPSTPATPYQSTMPVAPLQTPNSTSLPPQKSNLPYNLSSMSSNAVASSSKVPIDRAATFSNLNTPAIPSGPRSLVTLTNRALEKSPVFPSPFIGLRQQPQAYGKRSSPPPDPKSLVYIPSGPSSNPLNIRPSVNTLNYGATTQKAPPTAPKVLAQPNAKKRVIVGTGWPFVKVNGGMNHPSSSSLASPPSQPPPPVGSAPPPPPPPPPSGPRSLDPLNIMDYLSPSPPSTPASTINKWKRVAGDIPSGPAADTPGAFQRSPSADDQRERKFNQATVNVQAFEQLPNTTPKTPIPLKDRIGPASALPVSQPSPSSVPERLLNSLDMSDLRDLRSRLSDPVPQMTPTNSVENRNNKVKSPNIPDPAPPYEMYPRPASLPSPTVLPLTHPLPPRPVLPLGSGSRGIKRERPVSPDLGTDFTRRRRHTFRWPTVDSNYSVALKGNGDLAIQSIVFNSDGSHFALSCADRTIRIWSNRDRAEMARLSHNSPIIAVHWMEGDIGVISLGEDGLISKWSRSGQNHWQWSKLLDIGGNEPLSSEDQVCLAYYRDRVAMSSPRTGVKLWLWSRGTWQPQRSILRQNVTAIQFVEDGTALLGGTRDGVLWYCEIPNGTLRAYAFLKSKIISLDLNPSGSHVLVGQVGGCARLVGLRQANNRGSIEQSYSCKETEARPNTGLRALFATEGQAILFGNVDGCVLVWDRKKGAIVYGLEHEEDDDILAIASFDGMANKDGYLLTGTKSGHLSWWSQPVAASYPADDIHKRTKVEA